MDYRKIAESIKNRIEKTHDREAYKDLLALCIGYEAEDFVAAHQLNSEVRKMTSEALRNGSPKDAEYFYTLHKQSMLFDAPHDFDTFLLYVEMDRKPEKRFYAPRRRYLRPIVQGYQDVLDGKLRLLTISLPKRAGKSQLGINFINMISGRNPDKSSLMEGTGDDLVRSFYNGCLENLQTPNEYLFYDVFPDAPLVQTNADTKIINLRSKSRFPTVMCRSIDARQVGLSEATNVLYLDDCVEGREEAKNRQRLDDKWEVISGDILGRAIEGTPIVATGTRYSLYDPIGHLQEEAQKGGWAWKAIEIPALDPITDESNKSELNYFFELPADRDPDAIIAVADTAESGKDSTAMPIAALYGDEVYIVDVVYDDSPAEVTKPECARCLIDNKVGDALFESNNAGMYFARDVAEIVKNAGFNTSIRTKRTISNKQTRIEFASDGIKKNFYFKHPSTYKRGCQYWGFMQEVTTYVRSGKVAHDDAPDSLSLLENEIRNRIGGKIEIFKRPF